MKNGKEKSMFVREYLWRDLMTVCGLFVILLTIVIGAFLVYKGSSTFLVYRHSFLEFLGSADWAPEDNRRRRPKNFFYTIRKAGSAILKIIS